MENSPAPYKGPLYQDKVRKRLHAYNLHSPKGVTTLALEIGIKPAALKDFLEDGLDTTYKQICLIEKFLNEKEMINES